MNLKKFLALEVRQKSDISERLPVSTLILQHGRWVAVRLVRGHLTPKMNIIFFYNKLDAEYRFIQQFLQKKQYFMRKS